MNKKYIVRKNEEIQRIVQENNKVFNKYYVLYYKKNDFSYNRYCISVSKKIGKANVRNLFKRRIKDILMKNNLNSSCDYVIILRNGVLSLSYNQMKDEIINLLKGEVK